VRILGDGTQEFTTPVTNRLQEELGVITTSFAPIGAVVGGGAARVTIGSTLVVEEKTTFMFLLVLVLFLCLYCNHNKNMRKEK
jgi:hypothetical protein